MTRATTAVGAKTVGDVIKERKTKKSATDAKTAAPAPLTQEERDANTVLILQAEAKMRNTATMPTRTKQEEQAIAELRKETDKKEAEIMKRREEEAAARISAAKEKAEAIVKAKLERETAKQAAKEKRDKEAAESKAAKEAEKKAKAEREPDWVTQLDEHGNPETVDRNVFQFEVKCCHPGCTESRWVTLSGLREVTMCKPHARKTRRARRLERVKDRNANYKTVVEAALELGLFPEDFMKKHGLV